MKNRSFIQLWFIAILVLAGPVVAGTGVAQAVEATFFVTNPDDSGAGSLRVAILAANASPGADAIIIQVDGTVLLESPLPAVTEDVSIAADGFSFIIDGSSQYRIFEVPAGVRLELSHLEMDSGTAGEGNGGAIWNAGTLDIQNCIFLANFSELGGAIYNTGSVHLGAGTQVLQSNATQGAGIYNLGVLNIEETIFSGNNTPLEGGAIYNAGTFTVQGGEFSDGFAMTGAGIYTAGGGSMTVDGSTFTRLETNQTGAAISVSGVLVLRGATLSENQSGWGGSLYIGAGGTGEIETTRFVQNNAETGGSVMNEGTLTMTNSILSGNRAEGNGGAVVNTGTLVLDNTNLTQNFAVGDGGGLHNAATGIATLTSVTMQGNEARAGGGLNNAGSLLANANTFASNSSDWGAGIQNSGSLDLQAGQVIDNQADGEGGGLYNTGTLALNEVLVARNRAGFEGGELVNQGNVLISAGRFESNDGGDDFGGAISNRPTGTLQIDATDFAGNSVNNGGGAIFSSGALIIQGASFTGNTAKWGGAIHNWLSDSAVISGTSFTGNSAGHWGGAILNDGNLELEDCIFTDNLGVEFSGALHNNGDLVARRVTFSGNSAAYGSGGAVENGGTAIFEESSFENNHAVTNGGAISSVSPSSDLTLTGVTLSQNDAVDGGAIYTSASLHLSGVTFTENKSTHFGGVIYNGGSLDAIDSQFIQNGGASPWTQEGGAVYNATGASVSFSSATFDRNFAWYNGGAIASYGPLVISGSDFINNGAMDQGGAIYLVSSTASLQDSSFSGNETQNYAGAIATYDSNMEILRCLITGSYSWYGGAIRSGGVLRIENSTISHNTAHEGPAIQNYATTTLAYTTLFRNEVYANEDGAALQNYASLSMANTIVAGTGDGANCYGGISRTGPNISDDYSCPGFIVTGPKLGPLQDNGGPTFTHALWWDSPALDAALGECPSTDQRGEARPQGIACDLGAYEATPFVVPIDIAPKSSANLINLQSTGSVSVAVLSVPGFFAPDVVSRASLLFGATGYENPPLTIGPSGKLSCSAGDVNGDGVADLVCKFTVAGTNFTCSSRVGILTGTLQNGDTFASEDLVRPFPCP